MKRINNYKTNRTTKMLSIRKDDIIIQKDKQIETLKKMSSIEKDHI